VSVLRFETSRQPGAPATGFDMGDIEVTGNLGTYSSAGWKPSQSMMVYLSLVELLSGMSRFAETKSGHYAFMGVDSSFRLDFALTQAGVLTIIGRPRRAPVANTDLATLLVSVRNGVEHFLSHPDNQLAPADAVAGDLRDARRAFEAALRRVGV
jgi:hypothetical protein